MHFRCTCGWVPQSPERPSLVVVVVAAAVVVVVRGRPVVCTCCAASVYHYVNDKMLFKGYYE